MLRHPSVIALPEVVNWKFLSVVFVVVFLSSAAAQSGGQQIDSLQSQLEQTTDVEQRILLLDELAWQLRKQNPRLSIYYAKQELSLSAKAGQEEGLINSWNRLGFGHKALGQYDSAIYFYAQAQEVELANGNLYGIARSANELGDSYRELRQFVIAKDLFRQSALTFASIQKPGQEATALFNLALCYRGLRQPDSAYIYFQKAIEIQAERGRQESLIRYYHELAKYYNQTGQPYKAFTTYMLADSLAIVVGDMRFRARINNDLGSALIDFEAYDSAEACLQLSLSLYDSLVYKPDRPAVINNLGLLAFREGRLAEAKLLFEEARTSADTVSVIYAFVFNHLGMVAYEENKVEQAIEYFSKSIALFEQLDNGLVIHPLINLSILYENQGMQAEALVLRKRYEEAMSDREKEKALALKQQLKIQEQSAQIKELLLKNENKDLRFRLALGLSIVLLLLFFVVLYVIRIRNRNRLEREKAIVEKKEAKLRGEETTKARIAKDIHDELGYMLNMVRKHFEEVHDSMEVQLDKQKHHYKEAFNLLGQAVDYSRNLARELDPVTLRSFGLIAALKDIQNSINGVSGLRVVLNPINMDQRLDEWTERNIYHIIQELASNVVKHAEATLLTIQIIRIEDRLSITVEDNGKGFDAKDPENMQGMGMKNLEERVRVLEGEFEIDSRAKRPEEDVSKGTSITIDIPLHVK